MTAQIDPHEVLAFLMAPTANGGRGLTLERLPLPMDALTLVCVAMRGLEISLGSLAQLAWHVDAALPELCARRSAFIDLFEQASEAIKGPRHLRDRKLAWVLHGIAMARGQ